jgi:hypothetical protein
VLAVQESRAGGKLPEGQTADALRNAAKNAPPGPEAEAIKKQIHAVLDPADNYGGRMSFRYVAPFAGVLVVVFGIIYLMDRARGGYRAEKIGPSVSE